MLGPPPNPTQTSLFPTEIAWGKHITPPASTKPALGASSQQSTLPAEGASDGSHIHATSVKTLASSTHKILPKCALDGAPTFCGARRSAPIGWDYRGRNSPTEPPLRFCCLGRQISKSVNSPHSQKPTSLSPASRPAGRPRERERRKEFSLSSSFPPSIDSTGDRSVDLLITTRAR